MSEGTLYSIGDNQKKLRQLTEITDLKLLKRKKITDQDTFISLPLALLVLFEASILSVTPFDKPL